MQNSSLADQWLWETQILVAKYVLEGWEISIVQEFQFLETYKNKYFIALFIVKTVINSERVIVAVFSSLYSVWGGPVSKL